MAREIRVESVDSSNGTRIVKVLGYGEIDKDSGAAAE